MTDLQNTFYILGIVYMVLNILLLIGIGVGIYFIFRAVFDIRKQVNEKMKYVEKIIHNPEDVLVDVGASLIRYGLQSAKGIFKRRNANHSS